jgi:ferredoxin
MSTFNISPSEESLTGAQTQDNRPVLEEVVLAADEERRQYHKALQQFFLSGHPITDRPPLKAFPAAIRALLQNENPALRFPAVFDEEHTEVIPFGEVLEDAFRTVFDTAGEDIVPPPLPGTAFLIQKEDGQGPVLDYEFQIKAVVKAVRQSVEDIKDPEVFGQQCDRLESHLLARKRKLIGFSATTPFELLNLQLKQQNVRNQQFLKRLRTCIAGLKNVLLLHEKDTDTSQHSFDFADTLVSFEKIKDLSAPGKDAGLSAKRQQRIQSCIDTLSVAYTTYLSGGSIVFTTQKLVDEFDFGPLLAEAAVKIADKGACAYAYDYYKTAMPAFVETIAAIRLAEVEMNYNYDEALHGPYFEGFDRSYLSDEDIQYFQSLIVIDESNQLTQQPSGFLALFAGGDPINVLAVNSIEDLRVAGDMPEADANDLELAALAAFRRNAFVFQGSAEYPGRLFNAFAKGLQAPYPALWNILLAKEPADLLAVKAAIESRLFPRLTYDVQSGEDFGSHFDISDNPQSKQVFPIFNMDIKAPAGVKASPYLLTMADFIAMQPAHLKNVEIIPNQNQDGNLIPLAEYLLLPQDTVSKKVPFIWMVDEQHVLRRAAIPVGWVRRCRARLAYWRFLQELGGGSSARLKHSMEAAKSEWEIRKDADIAALTARLQAEFEQTRAQDLEQAINKILYALLEVDDPVAAILQQPAPAISPETKVVAPPPPKAESPKEAVPAQKKGEEKKVAISPEAWVETDQCTSCSDCINLVPGVFKYNDNKQVVVHNPKGGSFAKIVAAAEKCPARCIHPGLPQDKNEKGLEKLLKRAEKYQ